MKYIEWVERVFERLARAAAEGEGYVRHGSASEKPTERELRHLEAEGAEARGAGS